MQLQSSLHQKNVSRPSGHGVPVARHFATVIDTSKRMLAMDNMANRTVLVVLLFSLTGCGGTKVLKEPEPLVVANSLSSSVDQNLSATLDWVIYRDGPGTWARNVDWDEYLIRVRNPGTDPIQITSVKVIDSLGTPVGAGASRSQLVKGTKETKKRYKGQGLEVKAGVSTGTLLAAGAVTAASVASAGGAVAIYGSSAAVAGVTAGVLLVPVLAVGGVMRGVNNSKVNNQIEIRQTRLPIQLPVDAEMALDVFFPLAPSPRQIALTYVDTSGEHILVVDTRTTLDGLHIVKNH